MKITPLNNKILLQEIKEESKAGIILPEPLNKDKQVQKGVVVSVSKGVELTKGDTVLFNGYAASDVKIEGEIYFLIDEGEILGLYK